MIKEAIKIMSLQVVLVLLILIKIQMIFLHLGILQLVNDFYWKMEKLNMEF